MDVFQCRACPNMFIVVPTTPAQDAGVRDAGVHFPNPVLSPVSAGRECKKVPFAMSAGSALHSAIPEPPCNVPVDSIDRRQARPTCMEFFDRSIGGRLHNNGAV